jgi:hypothetical protein
MGILEDAPPFERFGIWMESQTGLQGLQIDEAEFEKQTKETTFCKDKGTLASSDLS